MQIAVISLYGCPLHKGHLEYMELAKEYVGPCGQLMVILNSDAQAIQKRGICAVPMADRKAIISAIRFVDGVFESIDTDRTVCKSLERVYLAQQGEFDMYFLNSGDRSSDEVPEKVVCDKYGIHMVDLPAQKVHSSSAMIRHIVEQQHALRW